MASSDIAGVQLIFVGNKEVWLLAADDKPVSSRTRVGSYGGGSYAPLDPNLGGLAYGFPEGDKTLVEFEGEDGKVKVMTFYQMLRGLENNGVVNYKVAHLEITRDSTNPSKDTFVVKKTSPNQMFKVVVEVVMTPKMVLEKKGT